MFSKHTIFIIRREQWLFSKFLYLLQLGHKLKLLVNDHFFPFRWTNDRYQQPLISNKLLFSASSLSLLLSKWNKEVVLLTFNSMSFSLSCYWQIFLAVILLSICGVIVPFFFFIWVLIQGIYQLQENSITNQDRSRDHVCNVRIKGWTVVVSYSISAPRNVLLCSLSGPDR